MKRNAVDMKEDACSDPLLVEYSKKDSESADPLVAYVYLAAPSNRHGGHDRRYILRARKGIAVPIHTVLSAVNEYDDENDSGKSEQGHAPCITASLLKRGAIWHGRYKPYPLWNPDEEARDWDPKAVAWLNELARLEGFTDASYWLGEDDDILGCQTVTFFEVDDYDS